MLFSMKKFLQKYSVDEGRILFEHLKRTRGFEEFQMVDVGAFRGTVMEPFLRSGADVTAIEPHPARAASLRDRFRDFPNLRVIESAISDEEKDYVTLYDSNVSAGISSIDAWHHSHFPAHQVPLTRLSALHLPNQIDFLKIDAEGRDLSVLKSVDWASSKISIVMAEYDGAKYPSSGAKSWEEILSYLQLLGYTCIISEWYPVVQYGTKHRFRKFHPPGSHPTEPSWGNIIAFSDKQMLKRFRPSRM